jgi:hypothetical protein
MHFIPHHSNPPQPPPPQAHHHPHPYPRPTPPTPTPTHTSLHTPAPHPTPPHPAPQTHPTRSNHSRTLGSPQPVTDLTWLLLLAVGLEHQAP